MASKNSRNKNIPPCPAPGNYILVKTKNKLYWRLKRGTLKPAVLNDSFKKNAELTRVCGPAIKRIKTVLSPYLEKLQTGYVWVKMGSLLSKFIQDNGRPGYGYCKDLDLQPDYPLEQLLLSPYKVWKEGNILYTRIPIDPDAVKKHNRLVTDFVFEMILLCGDPTEEDALEVQCECSELFSFCETPKKDCDFGFEVPAGKPWMLLLKLACFEGEQKAMHVKHYGVKVVEGD